MLMEGNSAVPVQDNDGIWGIWAPYHVFSEFRIFSR